MMRLKPGMRLVSAISEAEFIVVSAPSAEELEVACGGQPVVPYGDPLPAMNGAESAVEGATLLGKRYGDETLGVTILCTKPGAGLLAVNGRMLSTEEPRALPASD